MRNGHTKQLIRSGMEISKGDKQVFQLNMFSSSLMTHRGHLMIYYSITAPHLDINLTAEHVLQDGFSQSSQVGSPTLSGVPSNFF